MKLAPLGDRAVLAEFADEDAALRFTAAARARGWPWLEEVVPAYRSAAVFFAEQVGAAIVYDELRRLPPGSVEGRTGRTHVIPCCYDLGPDLPAAAERLRLSPLELIARHAGTEYTVYAVGFCPGFPYLGYLPAELCGLPRLPSPRLRVEPGSVGLTGRQTGIYPLPRPGGWNLIGRTPLVLVDVAAGYFPLRAGDRVRFTPIDRMEFDRRFGERLSGE